MDSINRLQHLIGAVRSNAPPTTSNIVIERLQHIFNDLSRQLEISVTSLALSHYSSGIYSIDINGEPDMWFFDTSELTHWIETYELR